MALSEEARKKKIAYNAQRTKELTKLFCARLPKEEYKEIDEYLKRIEMSKVEFVRWAYYELKK